MIDTEKTSYIMLFCALMLVRKSRMNLTDLVLLYPFTGQAQSLVQKLARQDGAQPLPAKTKS